MSLVAVVVAMKRKKKKIEKHARTGICASLAQTQICLHVPINQNSALFIGLMRGVYYMAQSHKDWELPNSRV